MVLDAGVPEGELRQWVAHSCKWSGLVSSGFEYHRLDRCGSRPQMIYRGTDRVVIAEPFWLIVERSDRSDRIEVGTGWERAHFYTTFIAMPEYDGADFCRGFTGMLFDGAGLRSLLDEISTFKAAPSRRRGNPGLDSKGALLEWLLHEFDLDPKPFLDDDFRVVKSRLVERGHKYGGHSPTTLRRWLNDLRQPIQNMGFKTW